MSEGPAVDALILDLLAFIAGGERRYDEVMEAWRTSCPRLPVWEEANARNLIARVRTENQTIIRLTHSGRALLEKSHAETQSDRDSLRLSGSA